MIKLRITEKQYKTILLTEANSRKLLTENDKELVLGVAMLLGMNLSGLNKEMAHKYVSDDKSIINIKKTLNDEFKTNELIKKMEEKGMKDVKNKLINKAEEIVKNFDKMNGKENHDADMNIKIINNLTNL